MDPETGRQQRFPTLEEASVYPWWNWFMAIVFWTSLFVSGGQVVLPVAIVFLVLRGASWETDRKNWKQYNRNPDNDELPSGTICCDARTYAWVAIASWIAIAVSVGLYFFVAWSFILAITT